LVTLLTVLVIFIAQVLVGLARAKHGIKAPTTTGNLDFERVFRAHQNTLEQSMMFLPALWLAGTYSNPQIASYLGYAWVIGRLWYVFGYRAAAQKRNMGFAINFLSLVALFVMASWGLIKTFIAA
jgi:glutathione S-transferase